MKKSYEHFYLILAILIAALLLTTCKPGASENALSKKPILVWLIQFEEREEGEEFFSELMANRFSVIHPEVEVIISSMTDKELLEKFKADAQLGLGPDLLVGASIWVPELAEMGLTQNLSDRSDIDTSVYLSTAVSTLRYKPTDGRQEGLYGLPITLGSMILYYNKDLVDAPPPTTLPALLDRTAEGQKVALDTSFYGAFWGVQAFGGQLFDEEG